MLMFQGYERRGLNREKEKLIKKKNDKGGVTSKRKDEEKMWGGKK